MTHHSDFDAWQEPPPKVDWLTKEDADKKALRAFWRGTVVGGLLIGALIFASAAWGLDISGTTVTLEPSAEPKAFADVVMHNSPHNGPLDTGDYTLSQDGLIVGVSFTWDAATIGQDQITVTPPVGMTCKPSDCTATVIEGQTGRVTLFQFLGS